MEDTVKALEEKVALLEAKLGKESESSVGASAVHRSRHQKTCFASNRKVSL